MLLSRIRDIPDWPEPGVVFKDITRCCSTTPPSRRWSPRSPRPVATRPRATVDTVVGIEARGFILAAPVAHVLGVGLVPIRKQGKLPYRTRSASYSLEYGQATIEVHEDAFATGDRVLIVDDVLATGAPWRPPPDSVSASGASVVAVAVLMELGFLSGRNRLGGLDLRAC